MSEDLTIPLIQEQIKTYPVLLYMKGAPEQPACGFSYLAVHLLEQCQAEFHSINILAEPLIRQNLPLVSNWPTFPQLFVRGELIGGSDIMQSLYKKGMLQQLVNHNL